MLFIAHLRSSQCCCCAHPCLLEQIEQGKRSSAIPTSFAGRLNHNVGLNMVAKSLDGLSTGLWNGAVMATYIYLIEDNSNKAHSRSPVAIVHLTADVPRLRACGHLLQCALLPAVTAVVFSAVGARPFLCCRAPVRVHDCCCTALVVRVLRGKPSTLP